MIDTWQWRRLCLLLIILFSSFHWHRHWNTERKCLCFFFLYFWLLNSEIVNYLLWFSKKYIRSPVFQQTDFAEDWERKRNKKKKVHLIARVWSNQMKIISLIIRRNNLVNQWWRWQRSECGARLSGRTEEKKRKKNVTLSHKFH